MTASELPHLSPVNISKSFASMFLHPSYPIPSPPQPQNNPPNHRPRPPKSHRKPPLHSQEPTTARCRRSTCPCRTLPSAVRIVSTVHPRWRVGLARLRARAGGGTARSWDVVWRWRVGEELSWWDLTWGMSVGLCFFQG